MTGQNRVPRLAALIPAAGFSSRMHQYKPLLPMGKTTMAGASISLFRTAGIRDIIVVTGHNHDRLAPEVEKTGAVPVFNPEYEAGMFSSIQRGMAALPGHIRGIFLLPVDIPAVRPATVAALAAAFQPHKGRVIIPEFEGKTGHPPLIPARLIPAITKAEEGVNLRQILFNGQAPALRLPVHDRGILMDADTSLAYESVKRKYEAMAVPDREECLSIIEQELSGDPGIRAHSFRVAEIARRLGEAVSKGMDLDMDLIRAGALLHDIKRKTPGHDRAGKRFLTALGFPGVADIAGGHMTLAPKPSLTEKQIVYLADKLARGDRLDPDYPRRFREKARALPHARKEILNRLETAQLIHARIETAAGRSLQEIIG